MMPDPEKSQSRKESLGMKVVLARIDDRLMHGIVLTQYLPSSNAQRILVIDDAVANDPLIKPTMMMAKPNGYAASIITMAQARENILANKYGDQKVFLLVKTPVPVLMLLELGVEIPELIIGSTELLNTGIKLSGRAFITDEELAMYRKIKDMGTAIVVQHASTVSKVDMWKIVK